MGEKIALWLTAAGMILAISAGGALAAGLNYRQAAQLERQAYKGNQKVFDQLRAAAEANNPAAEGALGGLLYTMGTDRTHADSETKLKEAASWLRKAAAQGHQGAQFSLGVLYANGLGVPQNFSEAAKWFRKTALAGHAAPAFYLGLLYENGAGVPRSYAQAIQWYQRATRLNDNAPGFYLGLLNRRLQGAPQDNSESLSAFSMAKLTGEGGAEIGRGGAAYNLGMIHWRGRGVPQDITAAYQWFIVSASLGNRLAQGNMRLLSKRMTPSQIAKAYADAKAWAADRD